MSRSKLWNPFDSEVKGGEQASREFAAWLISDSAILEAYCEAIAGREVVCDCGLDVCPCVLLNTVARGARFRTAGLLTNPEWRLRVRTTLEKSCDVKYLGDCITKFIAARAGGISECARLLFAPVPNSQAKVARDLLPVRLGGPMQTERTRTERREHRRQARREGFTENQAKWVWLMSLGCNYLFAACSRLLPDCLTPDADKADSEHLLVHQTFARNISRVMSSSLVVKGGDLKAKLKGLVAGYSGHPLSLPEKLTAEQVESGLPPEGFGGKVNPLDIAIGETRRCLEVLEEALLPEDEWPSEPE